METTMTAMMFLPRPLAEAWAMCFTGLYWMLVAYSVIQTSAPSTRLRLV